MTATKSKINYYVLGWDGKTPVQCHDLKEWHTWFDHHRVSTRVDKTEKNGVKVSTVFKGIDDRPDNEDAPLLFETMIFGGAHNYERHRSSTWREAEEYHKRACAEVFDILEA